MTSRSALDQYQATTKGTFVARSRLQSGPHHVAPSRRSQRAAQAAALRARRRWLVMGGVCLSAAFGVAALVIELVS